MNYGCVGTDEIIKLTYFDKEFTFSSHFKKSSIWKSLIGMLIRKQK